MPLGLDFAPSKLFVFSAALGSSIALVLNDNGKAV